MTTKERLKAEIDNLNEADIDELYEVVKQFMQTKIRYQDETHRAKNTTSGLCGIWQDNRTAEEIINDIVSARSSGRVIKL